MNHYSNYLEEVSSFINTEVFRIVIQTEFWLFLSIIGIMLIVFIRSNINTIILEKMKIDPRLDVYASLMMSNKNIDAKTKKLNEQCKEYGTEYIGFTMLFGHMCGYLIILSVIMTIVTIPFIREFMLNTVEFTMANALALRYHENIDASIFIKILNYFLFLLCWFPYFIFYGIYVSSPTIIFFILVYDALKGYKSCGVKLFEKYGKLEVIKRYILNCKYIIKTDKNKYIRLLDSKGKAVMYPISKEDMKIMDKIRFSISNLLDSLIFDSDDIAKMEDELKSISSYVEFRQKIKTKFWNSIYKLKDKNASKYIKRDNIYVSAMGSAIFLILGFLTEKEKLTSKRISHIKLINDYIITYLNEGILVDYDEFINQESSIYKNFDSYIDIIIEFCLCIDLKLYDSAAYHLNKIIPIKYLSYIKNNTDIFFENLDKNKSLNNAREMFNIISYFSIMKIIGYNNDSIEKTIEVFTKECHNLNIWEDILLGICKRGRYNKVAPTAISLYFKYLKSLYKLPLKYVYKTHFILSLNNKYKKISINIQE